MWARVCREGGGRVQPNQFLRNMNVPGIRPDDGRRLEVVVNGLPLYHGMQVGIDATIVSPVRADGRPVPGADIRSGVALRTAERRKRRRYRELLATQRRHLLVAAGEVGWRWNEESFHFLVQLAKAKARQAPQVLRKSLELAWIRRWTGMLTHAAMDAFAASLLQEQPSTEAGADGPEPPTGELLTAER